MRDICEALEQENSDAEKELDELWMDVDALRALQKEVDHYGRPSVLDAQLDKMKSSLVDGRSDVRRFLKM